jgi:hypothetical protein
MESRAESDVSRLTDDRLRPAWMGELKERVSGLLPADAEACCLPQRSLFQLPHPSRFESS